MISYLTIKGMTMSNDQFVIGNIVKLKSGGPDMTIYSLERAHLSCQWFAGKKLERGVFHVDTIEPVKKAEE